MGMLEIGTLLSLIIGCLGLASYWMTEKSMTLGDSGEKLSAYECGFEAFTDARMKFEIIYYVIGILYLVFDLEIIFLFPLAAILNTLDSDFILLANIFIIIITIGFIYEVFIGALDLTK